MTSVDPEEGIDYIDETIVESNSEPQAVTEAQIDPVPRVYAVNRPWILDLPMGPTAFVLDRKTFEFGLGFDRPKQHLEMYGPFLTAKYGLTNAITLGVSAETITRPGGGYGPHLSFEPRWNFANTGDWSFTFLPTFGHSLARKDSEWGPTQDMFSGTAGFVASRAISDERKLHFSGTWGMRQMGESFGDTSMQFVRLSGAFELRPVKKHAFVFSYSPRWRVSTYEYTSGRTSSWTEIDTNLGLGYHFVGDHFGIRTGLEFGPAWTISSYFNPGYSYNGTSYPDYNGSWNDYSAFSLSGFVLAVDFRI